MAGRQAIVCDTLNIFTGSGRASYRWRPRCSNVRPQNRPTMRIVTWNCCRGPFVKKLAALEMLSPDIAVISEATCPSEENDQLLWFSAEGSSLGIQVRASGEYRIERLPAAKLPNCVVPIRVAGPISFNLLAVWTWPAPSYIKAFMNAITEYSPLLHSGETVVTGDFNGNPVFDKPGTRMKWSAAFSMLQEAGLVSAYHHVHEVSFGNEPHPTHYFRRKPEQPFHIDFCFVPQAWTKKGLKAQVVLGPEWDSISDHFPILVTTEA
jgi:exodeoxyribonuclease-3